MTDGVTQLSQKANYWRESEEVPIIEGQTDSIDPAGRARRAMLDEGPVTPVSGKWPGPSPEGGPVADGLTPGRTPDSGGEPRQ